MAENVVISRRPPDQKSQDYAFLRKVALEQVLQKVASESWTDHNVHDPGITMLEALCYAVTEAGLRIGMDMKDIIATSALQHPPDFQTARRVLTTAPVYRDDFRRILVDHAAIRNAWVFPLSAEPIGRYRALLEFEDQQYNSNLYESTVVPPALLQSFDIDIALPHWDDEDVVLLRQDVIVVNVVFDGAPVDIWNPIEGSSAYFARASVTVQPIVGPQQVVQIWIIAQITTVMNDPMTQAPLILDEVVTVLSAIGDNSPADQTLMKQLNRRVTEAHELMRIIRRYLRDYRNLCEDFTELNAVRLQEIALQGILEVGVGVNIEVLLSEIFLRIDGMITRSVAFHSIQDGLYQGISADDVLEGPILDHGILTQQEGDTAVIPDTIYISDILRIIYQLRNAEHTDVVRREEITLRNIIAARNLALSNYLDNRPITTNARDCLKLVQSQRHIPVLSVPKSHLVVYRNGIEIQYDPARVLNLFLQGKNALTGVTIPLYDDIAVPAGEVFPPGDFYPVQYDLPRTYGVSHAGLPEQSTAKRQAQAKQLKGYLLHFEHLVSGIHAQMSDFNSFFSGEPGINHTLVQTPLYHIADMDRMLTAFNPVTDDWDFFRADSANPYATFLSTELESREGFLEKRNAVLDHLLAIQGEEMQERASLLLRLATQVPNAAALSLQALLQAQHDQKLDALEDIIEDKSAYYRVMPELNRDKYQAFGNPLWRRITDTSVIETSAGFQWTISIDNVQVFRNAAVLPASDIEARRQADEVIKLATNRNRYTIRVEAGGQRRLEIRTANTAQPIGESVVTFNTNPLAQAAIITDETLCRNYWLRYALIPYECRLYHLLGIDIKERRQITQNIASFIEIFDEVDVDPFIEKRFRMWEQAGFAGTILMESVGNFPGATDPVATANAQNAVRDFIRLGINSHQYNIRQTGPATFVLELLMDDGTAFAVSPLVFNSMGAAEIALQHIRNFIYSMFSGQGLYCVEHPPLFPDSAVAPLNSVLIKDTYSFQLTLILPSGHSRDFGVVNSPLQDVQPDLYRSIEFRKYAEQQIRKHCPAHLLPRILWVHRASPGTVIAANDACFENFETAYHEWCREYLSDEPLDATLTPLRDRLVTMLNLLYHTYYVE
jgi:hypothetical protein